MMSLEFYTFAHLKTAKHEIIKDYCSYKSGASFTGSLKHNKKSGVGVFLWPSGDKYEGEYLDNKRHGKGRQEWGDGSFYEGDFIMDTRHGRGYHKWANGESYEGSFFKDYRHGYGLYTWAENMKFEGKFYMNNKEGYGIFVFPNGIIYKGLYKEDEREGPGILTYPDKTEDIGLWEEEKLIKLTSQIEDVFNIKDYTKCDYFSDENMITKVSRDQNVQNNVYVHNEAIVQGIEKSTETDFALQLNRPPTIDLHTLQYDKQEYDISFFSDTQIDGDEYHTCFASANNTPSVINMQKQILKHKGQEKTLHYPVSDIIQGKRGNSCKGPIEIASENLICSAKSGDYKIVSNLLCSNQVNANVADKQGQHALLAAAVNMHCDIINCLLDNGADVNKLNDEGISALAACHVIFYPVESFQYNIAERYLQKPKEEVKYETALESQSLLHEKNIDNADNFGEIIEDYSNDANDEYEEHSSGSKSPDDVDVTSNLFDSNKSLVKYNIEVNDDLVERSATVMSGNPRIVAGRASSCAANEPYMDRARLLAIDKAEHSLMQSTIRLLLKRGADPNASRIPMPVLYFAIKAADVEAVNILLQKGASTKAQLSAKNESLTPLHIASAIRGKAGVEMTKLLLEAGADPNVCTNDHLTEQGLQQLATEKGSRTPLHIVCNRDDDNKLAKQIVRLLLLHGANPNILCRGQSPLSLAIATGNDLAIDELLAFSADPSLPLGQGIGSALCVASNTAYEFRRSPQQRINLIDKLVKAGANILAPIEVGAKKQIGTAVDYAYFVFNQDRRIAHMPYHALTHAERDTYNARRRLLAYLGDILRQASVSKEKERLIINGRDGLKSVSPSPGFLYTGAGAQFRDSKGNVSDTSRQVVFDSVTKDSAGCQHPLVDKDQEYIIRKPLFKYCYECGRTLGVRLSACTRCKEVYYCSKACKLKAWNARHKEECLRVGGHSRSPSPTSKAYGKHSSSMVTGSTKQQGHTGDNMKGQLKIDKKNIAAKSHKGFTSETFVNNDITENYSFN